MNAKKWWKTYHRTLRIAHRESMKAAQDMMIYGTGMVYVGEDAKPDGVAQHIPMVSWNENVSRDYYGYAPWDHLNNG